MLGIIRHSSSKKIDVDDLRSLLADQLRQTKPLGSDSIDISIGEQPTKMSAISGTRKRSRSRSKGPAKAVGHSSHAYHEHNSSLHGDMNGSAATLKMYEDDSAVPAWYRTLKKNIN